MRSLRVLAVILSSVAIGSTSILAQQQFSPASFGSVAVGNSSGPQTLTLTFNSQLSSASAAIKTGTEFIGTLTCNSARPTVCSGSVTFSPQYPGRRQDAIVVTDSSGNLLGSMALSGTASGPSVSFIPGVAEYPAIYNLGATALAITPSGRFYVAAGNEIVSFSPGTPGDIIWGSLNGNYGLPAGNGGPATEAAFANPSGLAIDLLGNVYIADTNNNMIRRVDAFSGIITEAPVSLTLAKPEGIALNNAGTALLVADTGNHRILQVNLSDGVATILAGSGFPGYTGDGGPASAATLNSPSAVAQSSNGVIYVADSQNNVVRAIDNSGNISTFAGNGIAPYYGAPAPSNLPAIEASLGNPSALATDTANNVYITEGSFLVRVDSSSGNIFTLAGNGSGFNSNGSFSATGPATSLSIASDSPVALDSSGNIYVTGPNSEVVEIEQNTAALNFAQIAPNSTGNPSTLWLTNAGNSGLAISALAIPAGFVQPSPSTDCAAGANVSAGAECSITLEYSPGNANQGTSTASVTDNNLNVSRSKQDVTLEVISPAQNNQSLALSSTYLSFGNVAYGSSSTQSITITNPGPSYMTVGAITSSDAEFSETNNCPAGLSANASCQITITYTPQNANSFGSLTIANNGVNPAQQVTLSGQGTTTISISPAALNFGTQKVNTTSAAQSVLITNTGAGPFSGIATTTSAYTGFGCSSIPAGTSCTVNITFTPSVNGPQSGALNVIGNLANSPQSIQLTGSGTGGPPPTVTISSPNAAASLAGLVTATGTAFAQDGQINSVYLSVDGVPAGAGCSETASTNVFTNCSSWTLTFDSAALPNGFHMLSATVTTPGGNATTSIPITVANWNTQNPMHGWIDIPSSGQNVTSKLLNVAGWSVSDDSAISSVNISVDGTPAGTATYGNPRADVCAAYPFRAGCPNVGWNYVLDTSKLSNGSHTLAVTSVSNIGETLITTTTFETNSNPVHVWIDIPVSNATLSSTASVAGWAIDDQDSIQNVALYVDGVATGLVAYGTARPDVCEAYPGRQGCPNVGWTGDFDTTQLSNGQHTLTIAVTSATGDTSSASTIFTSSNNDQASQLDISAIDPQSGKTYSGTVTFSGCIGGQYTYGLTINAFVDGAAFGLATVNEGNSNCSNSVAWSLSVDTSVLSNGSHVLTLLSGPDTLGVLPSTPYSASFPFTASNTAAGKPIHIWVDNPASGASLSGSVTLAGWAVDDNDAISTVSLSVNGMPIGTATYGSARSDVCAVYTNRQGCPNVGWSLPFNTQQFPDGAYTLSVTATSAGGLSYTLTQPFTISGNPVKLWVDVPNANSGPLAYTATFAGWAVDSAQPISEVDILVDGVSYGTANYGTPRADVCTAYPNSVGCPNVGWNIQIDTTHLSNGVHTLYVQAVTGSGQTTTLTTTFTVANSGYAAVLMIPISPSANGGVYQGTAIFQGCVEGLEYDGYASVSLYVDGVALGSNNPALSNSACANQTGWGLSLDTTKLTNGSHTLTVDAFTFAGTTIATFPFTVANGKAADTTRVWLDTPIASPMSGEVTLAGWAVDSVFAISAVTIAVDGVKQGTAGYGLLRADVCQVYSGVDCPDAGWNYSLDTTQLPDGQHTLDIIATNAGGESTTITRTFTVSNAESTSVKLWIELPTAGATLTGSTNQAGGWAVDATDPIASVQILIDGVSQGAATYGIARPDVCAVYADPANCPNVGWSFNIDSTLLDNGTHTLDVVATTKSGAHATVSSSFSVLN